MKKLGFLAVFFLTTSLWGASYFESAHYTDTEGEGFSRARDLVQKGQEYKSFFFLDQVARSSRESDQAKVDALIFKGWLDYRYFRYREASESWQKALDLAGSAHPWVNLWLSWSYLVEGDILASTKVFENAHKPDKADLSLFLTLENRLSVFRVPLKEADTPYLDYVTYLEATDKGIYVGNLYGGLSFFDATTSKITVIERARPSMESNSLRGLIETADGYYLAKKTGLFWLEKGGKRESISFPPKKGKNNPSLVRWVPWADGFVALFAREGLWFYSETEKNWELISEKVRPDSFLLNRGKEILYLNEQNKLTAVLWLDQRMGKDPFVLENVTLAGKFFDPVEISNEEFWLANPAGDISVLSFTDGVWQSKTVRQGIKGQGFLAFWRGESGLFSALTERGQWQRFNASGELVDGISFPLPILAGLIHHLSVGNSYVWINIASEVYALREKLLFKNQ